MGTTLFSHARGMQSEPSTVPASNAADSARNFRVAHQFHHLSNRTGGSGALPRRRVCAEMAAWSLAKGAP
jgi:hypothetical protein